MKVLRERELETSRKLGEQRLLSAGYSLIQQNYLELQYHVDRIYKTESYSGFRALRRRSSGGYSQPLLVYANTLQNSDDIDVLLNVAQHEKHDLSGASLNSLTVLIVEEESLEKGMALMRGSPFDNLWSFSETNSSIRLVSSSNDKGTDQLIIPTDSGTGIMENFPHPYTPELDPLIKFSFVSLNDARSGKYSLSTVLHEAAELAYTLSVGQDRDAIRSDLLQIVMDMSRAGILTVRGDEIYFPRNSVKLRKAFVRKYWDYVEKLGKTTLFDFETPF